MCEREREREREEKLLSALIEEDAAAVTYPWYGYVKFTYNVHKMFIYNIGIQKHKNNYDFLVQVLNFLLPLNLKVFRHKEIDTPDFSISPKPRVNLTQSHGEQAKVNRLLPWQNTTNFSQISQNTPRTLPVYDVIHIPRSYFYLKFVFWHLWMTHPPLVRVNICAQVAPN